MNAKRNVLYVKKNECISCLHSKAQIKSWNQIILLMIPNRER